MPTQTKIEWTDTTWNPVTGCTKISSGCKYCYAERMARRLKAMGQERYRNGFDVTLHYDLIEQPLKWIKPRMIFVNSMSDLFHEEIPCVQNGWNRFYINVNTSMWNSFSSNGEECERKKTGRILHGKTYNNLPKLAYKHRSAHLLFHGA